MGTIFQKNQPKQQQEDLYTQYYQRSDLQNGKGTKVLPPLKKQGVKVQMNMARWLVVGFAIFVVLFLGIQHVDPALLKADPQNSASIPTNGSAITASDNPVPNTHFWSKPTLTADQINLILAKAGSPAAGTGEALYKYAMATHVDDSFALAVFYAESQYGALGVAKANKSISNFQSYGTYVTYISWEQGYQVFYTAAKMAGSDSISTTLSMIYTSNPPNEHLVMQKMKEYTGE